MPRGGSILIETAPGEMDEYYVSQHPGSVLGEHVVLKVSDTGCGMEESVRLHMFEPFFTTKGGQGTGLGLSTVYGIVKQTGGSIHVYSEPGNGTTFKMFFPKAQEKAEQLALPEETTELPRGTETLLVVEDDQNLRDITVRLLQDGGYQVVDAHNAEEALRIVAASEPGIDLVLTDVVMSGTSGAELVKKISQDKPNLRSVFMSGYTSDLVERQGLSIKETGFLEKPFTRRSLLMKVYAALHDDSIIPPIALVKAGGIRR